MSHADTIHATLTRLSVAYPGPEDANKAHAALDALVAENQQLREALTALVHWWDLGDGDPDDQFETARAALAGTPSEDT
jgi:hypothetical protein